jgi:hypothetical protein
MTDDTRLDARVRGALTELPAPGDQATREALRVVLDRSSGPRRTPRSWVAPAVVAATVALLLGLLGAVLNRPDQDVPTPAPAPRDALTGEWQQRVTGVSRDGWAGRWHLVLEGDGVLALSGPKTVRDSTEGASYEVTSNHLRVDVFVNSACPEQPAGVYEWRVTGDRLVLDAVSEPCLARAELFVGTWTRVR